MHHRQAASPFPLAQVPGHRWGEATTHSKRVITITIIIITVYILHFLSKGAQRGRNSNNKKIFFLKDSCKTFFKMLKYKCKVVEGLQQLFTNCFGPYASHPWFHKLSLSARYPIKSLIQKSSLQHPQPNQIQYSNIYLFWKTAFCASTLF